MQVPVLNTRVRARRGLRVPPALRGRAGVAGGGRSVGPRRLLRACVCRARRGRAKAYVSGMIFITKNIPRNQTNMQTLTLTRGMYMRRLEEKSSRYRNIKVLRYHGIFAKQIVSRPPYPYECYDCFQYPLCERSGGEHQCATFMTTSRIAKKGRGVRGL
eukprot:6021657-Pleurochrysis_carterae.AAC.1